MSSEVIGDGWKSLLANDANGNVIKEIDAKGYFSGADDNARYETVYTYNLANLVTKIVDPKIASKGDPNKYAAKYEYNQYDPRVVELQQRLGITADGYFGSDTLGAVTTFQYKHGLTADGIVGPQTWNALNSGASDTSNASDAYYSYGSSGSNVTRAIAEFLIGNPINVYATQHGWFKDLFYAAGFVRDDDGVYHARQDSLQQYGGYNDFYDTVFHYDTSMDKAKFPFSYDSKEYIFWAWKGDYLNLGAGAEMGIYTRLVVNGTPTDHWLVDQSLAMLMTLTLKDNRGNRIFNYKPSEKQWWVTGFNPYYQDVQASDLTAIYTVDFSGKEGMYNDFYNTWRDDEMWRFTAETHTATFTF